MPKNVKEERLHWILPIVRKEVKLRDLARLCSYIESSLKRWKKAYQTKGDDGSIPKSTQPKTQPNETPIRIKEEVISLRKKTGLCEIKIHWKLVNITAKRVTLLVKTL